MNVVQPQAARMAAPSSSPTSSSSSMVLDNPNRIDSNSNDISRYYKSTCYANAIKADKSEKVGLVVKRSSVWNALYISGIKERSKFANSKLKVGMVIRSINGKPCPKTVKEIQTMMTECEGDLTIVAATVSDSISLVAAAAAAAAPPPPPRPNFVSAFTTTGVHPSGLSGVATPQEFSLNFATASDNNDGTATGIATTTAVTAATATIGTPNFSLPRHHDQKQHHQHHYRHQQPQDCLSPMKPLPSAGQLVHQDSETITVSTRPETVDGESEHYQHSMEFTMSAHQNQGLIIVEDASSSGSSSVSSDLPLSPSGASPGSSSFLGDPGRIISHSQRGDSPMGVCSIDHTGGIMVTPKRDGLLSKLKTTPMMIHQKQLPLPPLEVSTKKEEKEGERKQQQQKGKPKSETKDSNMLSHIDSVNQQDHNVAGDASGGLQCTTTTTKEVLDSNSLTLPSAASKPTPSSPSSSSLPISSNSNSPQKTWKQQQQEEQDKAAKKRAQRRQPRLAPPVAPGAYSMSPQTGSTSSNNSNNYYHSGKNCHSLPPMPWPQPQRLNSPSLDPSIVSYPFPATARIVSPDPQGTNGTTTAAAAAAARDMEDRNEQSLSQTPPRLRMADNNRSLVPNCPLPGAQRVGGGFHRRSSHNDGNQASTLVPQPTQQQGYASSSATATGIVSPTSNTCCNNNSDNLSGQINVDSIRNEDHLGGLGTDVAINENLSLPSSSYHNSSNDGVGGDHDNIDDEGNDNNNTDEYDSFSRAGSIEISEAPEMSIITTDDLVVAAEVQESPEVVEDRVRQQILQEMAQGIPQASEVQVEHDDSSHDPHNSHRNHYSSGQLDDSFGSDGLARFHKHRNVKERLFGGDGKGRDVVAELAISPDQYIRQRECLPRFVQRNQTTHKWIVSVVTNQKACDEDNVVEQDRSKVIFSASTEQEAHETGLAMAAPYLQPIAENPICFMCKSKFAVFRRPHQCRNCGVVVCSKCSVVWSRKRLPSTYQTSKSTHSVCLACDWSANEFEKAVKAGNLAKAKRVYASGNINLRSPYIPSKKKSGQEIMHPIHMAIQCGNVDMVRWLCKEHCVPVTQMHSKDKKSFPIPTSKGRTPLKLAIQQKNYDVLKFLVTEMNVSLDEEDIKADFRWILFHLTNTLDLAPYRSSTLSRGTRNNRHLRSSSNNNNNNSSSSSCPTSASSPISPRSSEEDLVDFPKSSPGRSTAVSPSQGSRGDSSFRGDSRAEV